MSAGLLTFLQDLQQDLGYGQSTTAPVGTGGIVNTQA